MTGVRGTDPELKPPCARCQPGAWGGAAVLLPWAPFSGTVRDAAARWVSEILSQGS